MSEYEIPSPGEVPDGFFEGAGKITSGELAAILNRDSNLVRTKHEPTVTPSRGTLIPGQGPSLIVIGTTIGLSFGSGHSVYRIFKIPAHYAGNPSMHVHWTKAGNPNEAGKSVRWRASYTVWRGGDARIDSGATSSVVLFDDLYEDASSDATRYVYRTPDVEMTGFVPGYYVGVKIDVDFAGVTLASEPVLLSVDLVYDEYINK